MVVILISALVVGGVAVHQYRQGAFSALVMAVLTAICAALAFHLYHPFARALLYERMPAYADAAALIALFVIPLLALRWVLDAYVGGNVLLSMWPGRIAGGVLGLLTGMMLAGVFAVALQMLPFGTHNMDVFGYHPFDDSLRRRGRLPPFYPDDFTVGLVNVAGAFDGSRSFAQAHDNLLLELFCARNTAGEHGGVHAKPGMLKVVGAYEQPLDAATPAWPWEDQVPADPLLGVAGGKTKVLVVRAAVDKECRDEDHWWRLCATHFRLVTESGRSHYPLGYLTWIEPEVAERRNQAEPWQLYPALVKNGGTQVAQLVVERPWRKGEPALTVDWVYRLASEDTPAYLVFRRTAEDGVPAAAREPLPTAGALDRKR